MTRTFMRVLSTATMTAALVAGMTAISSQEAAAQNASEQYKRYHAAVTAVEECRGSLTREEHRRVAKAIGERMDTTQVQNELSVLQSGKNMMRENVARRGCSDEVTQRHLRIYDSELSSRT